MENEKKFYEKGRFITLMLFIFMPIGVFFLWKYHRKHKFLNFIVTLIFSFYFLFYLATLAVIVSPPLEQTFETDSNQEQKETAFVANNQSKSITTQDTLDKPLEQSQTDDKSIVADNSIQPENDSEQKIFENSLEQDENKIIDDDKDMPPESSIDGDKDVQLESSIDEQLIFKESEYFLEELRNIGTQKLNSDAIYLELNYQFFKPDYFSMTLSAPYEYIFFGELNNNGRPDGKGIILARARLDSWPFDKYVPYYCGNLKDGMFNGYGMLYEFNEGVLILNYVGQFSMGKKNGNGKDISIENIEVTAALSSLLGSDTYEKSLEKMSEDIDLYFEKIGEYWSLEEEIIADIPIMSIENYLIHYIGNFKNDKKEGQGKYILGEDLIYEGTFKNSVFSGKGKLYFANGKIMYDGDFSKGDPHGSGKLYYSDGTIQYNGKFSKGNYNGKGTLYSEDGSIKFKGMWKKGNPK